MNTTAITTTKFAIFKGTKVRKVIFQNEWWFSVVDIVEALTDSSKPRVYWNAMKTRVKSEDRIQLSTICRQLAKGIKFDRFNLNSTFKDFFEIDNFQTGSV